MVYDGRFLASLEMTAKQKEKKKKKAFSSGFAAAKRPRLSHVDRFIPNAVRNLRTPDLAQTQLSQIFEERFQIFSHQTLTREIW